MLIFQNFFYFFLVIQSKPVQRKPVQKDGGEVDDLTSDMTFILTESYKKCKDVIKIIKYIFTGLILTEMQLSLYQLQSGHGNLLKGVYNRKKLKI